MTDLNEALGESPEDEAIAEAPEQGQQAEPEQPTEPTAEAPAEPAVEEPKAEEPTVPLSVFKSMRDDLKGKIDQVAQQVSQPKPEPVKVPDMFEDPQAYQAHMTQQVQGMVAQTKLEQSRFFAEREFGKEAVQEVVEYFNQHPQLSHQFMSTPSPFHAAKEYVDAQKTAQEIGNDPAAYRARIEAEIRQKVEAEMAAKQAQDMAAKVAPSLANTNGSGGQTDPGWSGPTDLNSLIGE